jgi:NTE family protein
MPSRCAVILLFFFSSVAVSLHSQANVTSDLQGVARKSDPPPVLPSGRPVIGLALEGGGALGFAHIGVLQWFEEHHIPVDRLSGTSMGALVGALYATGQSPDELRKLADSKAITSVFTFETPYGAASYRRRQDRRDIPQVLTIGLKSRYGLRNALLADSGLNQFLSRELFDYGERDLDYNTLPIPFRCVATDLTTLQPVTFASGSLSEAVRASASLPGIFSPVEARNGHYLADGGIVENLPTGVMRREFRADVIIGIHLEPGTISAADTGSIIGVLNRAFAAGVAMNEAQSKKLADVLIDVPVGNYSVNDYDKVDVLIKAGYAAAEQSRASLLRYALDDASWQAYLAAREARRRLPPGILRKVRVEGGSGGAQHQVERDMQSAEGQPATSHTVVGALKDVQSNGEYEATYETFALRGSSDQQPPDAGILVHLRKEQGGPPFLLVGPDVAASTSNVTREELALRFIDQSLGGYGSEFRASARVGYLTDLHAEYYRLLSPGGYFLQPQGAILRQPVYIWANQKTIADRFQQNLDAGIEAGRTIGNSMQISAQWHAEDTHWDLVTGNDGGGTIRGSAQTGMMRFVLDKAATDSISPTGLRLSLAGGALYHAVDSANAPLLKASFSHTDPLGATNIFGIGAEINSYLRANVAEPFRFTLGGPLRLSASSFDEYRGTDTALARAGLMHRIAALPIGMGQGLYAVVGYEGGEVWSPETKSILRQDGTAGFVAATPLGVITLGVSAGDAGRRKAFFTIGRWF